MKESNGSLLPGALVAPLASPLVAMPLMYVEAGYPHLSFADLIGMIELLVVASIISVVGSCIVLWLVGVPMAWGLRRLGFLNGPVYCGLAIPVGAALLPSLGALVVTPMATQVVGGGLLALVVAVLFCKMNRIGFGKTHPKLA